MARARAIQRHPFAVHFADAESALSDYRRSPSVTGAAGMTLVEQGLWCWTGPGDFAGRGALFLDRDGVVVEDTDYLGRADDVRMLPNAAAAIARCNRLGIPVVLITNQSGIGRGKYDWDGFRAVQTAISNVLAEQGAQLDAVLACAYHADAGAGFCVADHAWRKPKPGMLLEAARLMQLDLRASWIVGDRASDIEAGRAAALAGGILLLTRDDTSDRTAALVHAGKHYAVATASDLADAVAGLLAQGRLQA
jgi:D-glycero-D-manno-heptose 1,7-bisphosphate phosphatase